MKTRIVALVLWIAAFYSAGLYQAAAEFEVSAGISIQSSSDFYQPLASEGAWIDVGGYGRCWRPTGVAVGWRPYCQGHWEWTDCGWYWESDEPWGWACYHYGSWVLYPNYGWVWVPGVQWAPAWVYWRTGGDYIGWAPCGPSGVAVEASAYVFVQGGRFHDKIRPETVIVNNVTIVNETHEIRNITREQRDFGGKSQSVYVNNGPGLASVEKVSGHKYSTVPVQQAYRATFRLVPERLQRTTTEPVRETQHPVEISPKMAPGNQAMPRRVQPNEQVPLDRSAPVERTAPAMLPERTFPQKAPTERDLPRTDQEVPTDRRPAVPKQVILPGQGPHVPVAPGKEVPHPQVPVAPPNTPPPPRDNIHDKDQHNN